MKRRTVMLNTRVQERDRRRLEAQAERIPPTWGPRPNRSDAARLAMRRGLGLLETADRLRGDD